MTAPAMLQTTSRLIRMAYQDAGLLQEGDEPNGLQYADGLMRLCDLINMWQTSGLKLWLYSDLPVTLVAGTATYTFGPAGSTVMTKPLRVIQGYYLDANDNTTPLTELSWDEYKRLSQRTSEGTIINYFVDKQATQLSVAFWMVPDATAALGKAHLIVETQATNPVSLTETHGFPAEWAIALRWGLADELATGQPQAIVDRCERKAAMYRLALENWDVEDASTRFTPSMQGGGSSFS